MTCIKIEKACGCVYYKIDLDDTGRGRRSYVHYCKKHLPEEKLR